tara:strand:- start:143 stop:577 length:435 start_codon:yes stop_codon:yes gene_type:complete
MLTKKIHYPSINKTPFLKLGEHLNRIKAIKHSDLFTYGVDQRIKTNQKITAQKTSLLLTQIFNFMSLLSKIRLLKPLIFIFKKKQSQKNGVWAHIDSGLLIPSYSTNDFQNIILFNPLTFNNHTYEVHLQEVGYWTNSHYIPPK